MRKLYIIRIKLAVLSILYSVSCVQAQYSGEIQSLKLKYPDQPERSTIDNINYNNDGLTYTAGRVFNFYKKFISSQDHGSCSFIPSCSEYALISIREQGFLVGSINTLDRLSRCNGRNKRYYLQDEITGLSIDEVRNHKYEKN